MTQEEREQLKAELRKEIVDEINSMPNRKHPEGLKDVKTCWFGGAHTPSYASRMGKILPDSHYAWDAIRTLTRLIYGKKNYYQLVSVEQEDVKRVANALCELVYQERFRISQKNKAELKEGE